jgi:ketosteroid isomerase-like protein
MSEKNVEIVRTALTALDQRDVDLYLSVASPQIELINPASALEGPSIGHEGVRRFFRDAETYTGSSNVSIEEIRVVGPRVLAIFTPTARGRMSGVETSTDLAGVYSFEEGKIRRARIFVDRETALEEVGLAE